VNVVKEAAEAATLGAAVWEKVARKLPGSLRPLPGYPVRFMAADFPEGWQLASLDLESWGGPQT
jgi:hypothetical protein